MLLRGIVHLSTTVSLGSTDGAILYLNASTDGHLSTSPPSGSGEFARVIGYAVNASEYQIFFNPDNTYIELA